MMLFDANGDRVLSASEIEAAATVILALDSNRDGEVDGEELLAALPPPPPGGRHGEREFAMGPPPRFE